LKLNPRELFALTPKQLDELREGYGWREREEWHRLAWLTAHIMNASGKLKRPVFVRDLLPDRFKDHPTSIEEVQRALIEKQKRFEAARAAKTHAKTHLKLQISNAK
jgi:hypothetical protein